jgi:7-cyano-7-deazaguanine synthase in queuosine biosynthesis
MNAPLEKELVILLSGGVDSTISYLYAIIEKKYKPEDILCLYVDLGHSYSWKELEGIKNSSIPVSIIKTDILREEFNNIPQAKHPYSIILNRNLFLASIAAMYGKRIWICALKDEQHEYAKEHDKSYKFFKDTTDLLTYTCNIRREQTIVETPFSEFTKAELIGWALRNGVSKDYLLSSHTCYDDKQEKCGQCFVCFKRWVSFKVNGIDEQGYAFNPWESDEAKRLIENYKKARCDNDYSHYHRDRVDEALYALELQGVKL